MQRRLGAANAELDALAVELDATKSKLDATIAERDAAMERLRESAWQMKTDGMAVEAIAKYTGLTADEVAWL